MKKLRPIGLLLSALLVVGVMFAVCYWAASSARVAAGSRQPDELAWLCHEFRLTDAELVRIRLLHEGYKPQCEAMCARIAEKNRQLKSLMDGATNVSSGIEQKLAEVAALRAECQAQMLRHFQEVARSMPENQGIRYLAEMQRLTLGLQDHMEDGMVDRPNEHR
jgi:hypothetical protein